MTNRSILLVHPPVAKPCEAPAGLAKLTHFLRSHGVDCRVYDASIDGILGLLQAPLAADDTWTRRARSHCPANIKALRSSSLYANPDRYRQAVMEVNRVLAMAGHAYQTRLSLANYVAPDLSPVRSRDLIRSAEQFAQNPFYATFSRKLMALFEQAEPDILGVSINFMSQALCAFAIIGFVRQRLPGARIICGGGLVTSWMKIPEMNNPFCGLVDELVDGPGETRLLELCTGGPPDTASESGYDYSTIELNRYLAPATVLPYAASRGCWWQKCAFCPETAEDARYAASDPATVVDALLRLAGETGAGLIHFLDNALAPGLLEYLNDHPLPRAWYGFARITRHLTDMDFVSRLKKAGCVMLKLGVESGDQAVLDNLDKGIELNMVERALEALHRVGIATYVYLLFGTPTEDEASACKTLKFSLAHADCIDYLNLAIFNLPAHGREAAGMDTMDFYRGDLSLYREFDHPRGWNRGRVRRFLSTTFKKQTAIRTIINRDPPHFTSNHAPFLTMDRWPRPDKCN